MAATALRKDAYTYANPILDDAVAAIPTALPKAIPVAVPRPAHKPRLSVFSVLGFLFIGLLAVLCMLSRVELTRLSAEITGVTAIAGKVEAKVGLDQRLTKLREENRALRIEYERTFDLRAIELYATQELGMVKYSNTATVMSTMTAPADKAVIPESEQSSALQSATEFLGSLTEYFKR